MQLPSQQPNPWPMGPCLIELSAALHSKIVPVLLQQVMMLIEQHPYFVQRRSRASGYRRPCSSRAWSGSRVGTLPSFFSAGRRLYRSWTVHQCWCFTSTVGSFSFLILAFVWHAYPALVLFSEESKVRSFRFRFSLLLYSSLGHLLWNSFENRKRTFSGRKINHQPYGPETSDFFG